MDIVVKIVFILLKSFLFQKCTDTFRSLKPHSLNENIRFVAAHQMADKPVVFFIFDIEFKFIIQKIWSFLIEYMYIL